MIKKITFFIIFLIFIQKSYSMIDSDNNIIKIKIINTGNKEGEIGLDLSRAYGGGCPSPTTFSISSNNKIYIPDIINKRINIYDSELTYVKSVLEKDTKELYSAHNISIDKNGNILGISGKFNFIKINSNGETIFKFNKKLLSHDIKYNKNFFLIDDYIFYTDNKQIKHINNNENNRNNESTKEILERLNKTEEQKLITRNDKIKSKLDIIKPLKEKGEQLIIGDKFYSTNFNKNLKYYKLVQKAIRAPLQKSKLEEKNIVLEKLHDKSFINYDKEHNSYWKIRRPGEDNYDIIESIVIFSKDGINLDVIDYGRINEGILDIVNFPTTQSLINIASNGDIYFMKGSKEGYIFWKLERSW